MKIFVIALAAACLLAGCAGYQPRQMTRDEWLSSTTRTYEGVSKDQVISAAEKLFRLADGDDFKISHSEEGIYAVRRWFVYIVFAASFGVDYWKLTTVQTAHGVKASVQISTDSQGVAPMPTVGPGNGTGWTAGAGPMSGEPVDGTAIFDLFWARMDYLLGRRDTWMTCDVANLRVKSGFVWGDNSALCNSFNVDDRSPVGPVSVQN